MATQSKPIEEVPLAQSNLVFRETDSVPVLLTDANGDFTGETVLVSLSVLRAALAPSTLFLTTAPTATTPGREGQQAYVTAGQLSDLWQYEAGAWVLKLKGLVLGTGTTPAGPVPVVTLGAVAPGKVGVQLTLTATASEVGGAIAKVEFFDGATKVGEAATTPYATSYVPTSAGTHYFTAKATDANGRSAVSDPRAVVIGAAPVASNQLPSVSLSLTPADTLTLGGVVNLSAVASDSDGTIAKVEFFDGASKIGTATAPPYVLTYTPTTAGSRLFSAKATDNANGTAVATMGLVVTASATTPTAPTAPTLSFDATTRRLTATHPLYTDADLEYSEDAGPYQAYTGFVQADEFARPSGYFRFRVQAATGRLVGEAAQSAAIAAKATPPVAAVTAYYGAFANSQPTAPDFVATTSAQWDKGARQVVIACTNQYPGWWEPQSQGIRQGLTNSAGFDNSTSFARYALTINGVLGWAYVHTQAQYDATFTENLAAL